MEMGDRRDPFDTLLILRGGNRRETFKENRPAPLTTSFMYNAIYSREPPSSNTVPKRLMCGNVQV
jgi:hypothetical protein